MSEENESVTSVSVSNDYEIGSNYDGVPLGSTLTDNQLQHVININEKRVSYHESIDSGVEIGNIAVRAANRVNPEPISRAGIFAVQQVIKHQYDSSSNRKTENAKRLISGATAELNYRKEYWPGLSHLRLDAIARLYDGKPKNDHQNYDDTPLRDYNWSTGEKLTDCFPAGTPITLASGETVSIEYIAIADQIAAAKNINKETAIDAPLMAGTVSRLYTNVAEEFIELNFIDSLTGKQSTLTSTHGHVFLDETGNWRQIDDMIADANNVISIRKTPVSGSAIVSANNSVNLSENSSNGMQTKGQQYGTFAGSVNIVTAEGQIVEAQAYTLKYSAATADLYEETQMLVTRTEGGLACKPEYKKGWKTYNFEVAEHHNYIAGGIRVHNTSEFANAVYGNTDQFTGQGSAAAYNIWDSGNDSKVDQTAYSSNGSLVHLDASTGNRRVTSKYGVTTVFTPAGKQYIDFTKSPGFGLGTKYTPEQLTDIFNGKKVTVAKTETSNSSGIRTDETVDENGSRLVSGGAANAGAVWAGELGDAHYIASDGSTVSHNSRNHSTSITNEHGVKTTFHANGTQTVDFGNSNDSSDDSGGGGKSSPVIIDLDGDGIELAPQDKNYTLFDFDDDGFKERTAWVGADDGLLMFDENNDGRITSAKEIAFTKWIEEEGQTDIDALALHFDTNNDGKLDNADVAFSAEDSLVQTGLLAAGTSIWENFKIWQDANSNAIIDEGELKSLSDWNIAEIGLTYANDTAVLLSDNTLVSGFVDVLYSVDINDDGVIDEEDKRLAGDVSLSYSKLGIRNSIDENGNEIIQYEAGYEVGNRILSETEISVDLGGDDEIWASAVGNDLNNTLDGSKKTYDIYLHSSLGNDIVLGGAGNDILIGGAGSDTIRGGDGDDQIVVDAADLLQNIDGGEGYDTLIYDGDEALQLNLSELNMEAAIGGGGADVITGNDELSIYSEFASFDANGNVVAGDVDVGYYLDGRGGDDQLDGANHDDQILGGSGNDTIKGYAGNDVISGGSDADNLDGGEGNDILAGEDGDDILSGGEGDDHLSGGEGSDIINGGAGDDTYYYNRGDGADRIHDFAEGIYQEKYTFEEQIEYQYQQSVKRGSGKKEKWVNETRTGYRAETRTGLRDVFGEIDGGIDTLLFGTGIAISDIVLSRSGADMVVSLRDVDDADIISGDSITIEDWADQKNRIENFEFVDGTKLDFSRIMHGQYGLGENDTLEGTNEGDFLSGGNGDDTLNGNKGRDIITGGAGADTIDGGDDKDFLFGDAGDDTLRGQAGNDYLIGDEGNDTLEGGDGDDTMAGQDGDDTLDGGDGNDLLLGGTGSDMLMGGGGDDTYIYFRGDGRDEILDQKLEVETYTETYTERVHINDGKFNVYINETRTRTKTRTNELDGGNDILQFGFTIALDDLFFKTQGEDMLIGVRDLDDLNTSLSNMADQVKVQQWSDTKNRIETFELASGLKMDTSEVTYADSGYELDDILEGTTSGDLLSGGGGADTLTGLAGNDYLIGGDGNDNLHGGSGEDDLFGGAGDDLLSGGEGVDYLLGGAGNDTLDGGTGNDVLTGGKGDDILNGGLGNDTYIFNRGDGNDTIDETAYEQVQETFQYVERVQKRVWTGKSSSMAWVNETRTGQRSVTRAAEGGDDILQFGAYIDISDLIISMNDANLVIQLKPFIAGEEITDQVTIKNWETPEFRVEHMRFINDFSIDLGSIDHAETGDDTDNILVAANDKSSWIGGAGGDDQLTGSSKDDVLFGGAGEDNINGGNGDDVYIFNQGDGHDQISDSGSSAVGADSNNPGGDKLLFGSGITIEDLILQRQGNDLVVYVRDRALGDVPLEQMSDSLRIENWANESNRIEVFQFFDGMDFAMSQVTNTYIGQDLLGAVSSAPIDDTLNGSNQGDWMDGFSGNDTIHGASGNDFIFGREGNDTLFGENGDDILSGNVGDDYLSGGAGDDILSGGVGNDELLGGDGNDVLLGGEGNDTINGGSGDDVIVGDKGNDTFIASEGFDVYRFGYGDGQDIYAGSDSSSITGTDVVVLEDNIKKEALWFERIDNNLVMKLLGSEDSITYKDWFHSDEAVRNIYGIEAGDDFLNYQDVNRLVAAMASFDPNDGTTAYGVTASELPDSVRIAVDSTWKAA